MAFLVRKLHLLEDLYYFCDADESVSEDLEKNSTIDRSEKLYAYKTTVDKKNLEPKPEDFLREKKFLGYRTFDTGDFSLAKASYFFVQAQEPNETAFQKAAEAIYLEALWQNIRFVDDLFYLRILEEGGKMLFQILRTIETKGTI